MGTSDVDHAKPKTLRQDPVDQMAVDVGEASFDTVVIQRQSLVVDAEQMQDGGVEVVPMHAINGRISTDFVALAIGESMFEASPATKH